MATVAGEPGRMEEKGLFARTATGLVRGWSVWDGFVYAAFSINLVTLGLYAFSFAPFIPEKGLLWAVVLSGAYLVFQAITYSSLIAAMPRAGGDYIWISRVLGGGIGFVLAAAGWWFILWHWVPIYANILNIEVFGPISAIIGWERGISFWAEPWGIFVASVLVAAGASVLVALGLRTYARFQKICFYGGLVGLAVMFVLLLVHSKSDFISAYNDRAPDLYGSPTYETTLAAGQYDVGNVGSFAFTGIFLLIPFMLFFNLWSNWGATLYGEVRGASDFRNNIKAMGGALLATTAVAAIFLLLFAKTFGWDFYNGANNAYWGAAEGGPGFWPYPGMMAAFFFDNAVLQFLVIGLLSLWFFGWMGSVFLSSTRVVFATAFDRVLPEWAAKVGRNGVPTGALALMLVPAIPIAAFYAWDGDGFRTWTLNATLVIAITFLGSAVSAAIFPWRRPEIYNASPIAKYRVAGIPLITVAATLFSAILLFSLWQWWRDDRYFVNDPDSFIYLGCMYLLAIGIYFGSRLWRKRQGIDMGMVQRQIPAE